jgi:peptide/nickel transport system permease protein
MLKILRDLLRYNREFLAGAILLGIILVMVALSFVSS